MAAATAHHRVAADRGGPVNHRVLVKIAAKRTETAEDEVRSAGEPHRLHTGSFHPERRTHIAHFFPAEQWAECHQRMFRDWLRAHPEDCDRYAAAKRQAAAGARHGGEYTVAKRAVVNEITNRARAARGLPPVDNWDK